MIQNDEMMWQKLEYIHNNPVERGYVDDPLHWRYSSARNYAGQKGLVPVTTQWLCRSPELTRLCSAKLTHYLEKKKWGSFFNQLSAPWFFFPSSVSRSAQRS